MNRLVLTVSRLIRRFPVAVIAATMLAAGVLAFGIPRLEFKTGQETLINPDSKVARDSERFQSQFGGDYMLLLFEVSEGQSITQLFSADNQATLSRLQEDLENTGQYQGVISPLAILALAKSQVET